MKWNHEKTSTFLCHLGCQIVKIIGCLIFLLLTWYAFRYTQYMVPRGMEIPVNTKDSMMANFVCGSLVLAAATGIVLLESRIDKKKQRIIQRIFITLSMIWIGSAGYWWITSAVRVPEGDQAFIYGGASYFIEGGYTFLDTAGYCGFYPFQLGLMFLVELLFLVVGTYNFFAFECLCVFFAIGIVYFGYRILLEMKAGTGAVVIYSIMMMFCMPLIFYTSWVYGDLPSVFFILLAVWMLLAYSNTGKIRYLVWLVFAVIMSMLVRQNSMIFVVALCITGILYAYQKKDKKIIVAVLLAVILPFLTYQGIYKIYEFRSGMKISDGIPKITYIVMGLQEENEVYGWYNRYPKEVYHANGFDYEKTVVAANEDLEELVEKFVENPDYAKVFFREKVLSQWNAPLYQSIYFNTKYEQEDIPPADSFVSKISNEYYFIILEICDNLQFIIFVGMILYYLLAVGKDSNLLQHTLAIMVIGGFLFSIFWEAKSRYIFPYYMVMFPCAAFGYRLLIMQVIRFVKERKEKQKAEVPEKYHKSA